MAAAKGRPLRGYRLIGREIGFNQSCVPSELYVRPAELINSNTSVDRLLPLVRRRGINLPFRYINLPGW